MKFLRFLIALTINCVINFTSWLGIAFGIALICDAIVPEEIMKTLTEQHLIWAYSIGTFAGFIWWIIVEPLNKLIYEYIGNWKKEHSVRLTFNDGEDAGKPSGNSEGGGQLD